MVSVRQLLAVIAVPLALAGCAQTMGRRATAGAIDTIEHSVETNPDTRAVAREAVTGALSVMSSPENEESLEKLVAGATMAATRGFAESLREADGAMLAQVADRAAAGAAAAISRGLVHDAELRTELASATRALSASVIAGAKEQLLFPACAGPDRQACIEQHLADLSRAAARGATAGIVDAALVPLLAIAFLAGVLIAVVLVRTRRPPPPPAAGPAPRLQGAHGVS